MIADINEMITKKDLIELGELEQQIITGLDQGRKESMSRMKMQT